MSEKVKKIYWIRFIFCAVALCAALALVYSVYAEKGLDFIKYLTEEKEMPNMAWLVEKCLTFAPAFFTVLIVELSYADNKRYVTVFTQIEKLIVLALGAITVFAVLLPLAVNSTPVEIVTEDVTELKTLWDRTYMWFFYQIIPFVILIFYHALRIVTESGAHSVIDSDADDGSEEDDDE